MEKALTHLYRFVIILLLSVCSFFFKMHIDQDAEAQGDIVKIKLDVVEIKTILKMNTRTARQTDRSQNTTSISPTVADFIQTD